MSGEAGRRALPHRRISSTTEARSPENISSPTSITSTTSPYSGRLSVEMATLPPPPPPHIQYQDPYQSFTAYPMYSSHAQSFPPNLQNITTASQAPPGFPTQPAPRQRTAIACRYCRRRKIRCHGFDSSPDGRCTNCMRFHQECIFTPVNSQSHAFVPAHTAYPHLRNAQSVQAGPDGRPLSYPGQANQSGPPLYGAHGQPLGSSIGQQESNYASSPIQINYAPGHYSIQSSSLPSPPQQQQRASIMHYEERMPPLSDHRMNPSKRRGSSNYEYPDPTHMTPASPASSAKSYNSPAYPSSTSQPYYQTTPGDHRTSPTTSYFGSRSTGSPQHNNTPTHVLPLPAGLHPPQSLPPGFEGSRNHSPITTTSRMGRLSVADLLTPTSTTRSSTDSSMLDSLTRPRRNSRGRR